MSRLSVYPAGNPTAPTLETEDFDKIRDALGNAGIRLERWRADRKLPANADSDTIIAAYQAEIDRLVEAGGYQTWDVISLHPEHPDKDEFRKKFLDEHTHGEDEVRFFVNGSGLFYLHVGGEVYAMLCEKNDLISVPAGTRHWFDMGPNPSFTVIRLFNNPEGWVAKFTGDDIAASFPRYDN